MEQTHSILYVDDEQGNLTAFTAAFRKYYKVYTALNAKEGLEILRKHKIEIVLTDQRMPEMSGVQFLEAIIPEFPNTIRIIITGFSDIESIVNAINTGQIYRYVQKPWNNAELKLTLDIAMKTYELEEQNRQLLANLHQEILQKEAVLHAFKKYVPAHIVERALKIEKEEQLIAGAERRVISVLSSHIIDFNGLIKNTEANKVVKFLNDYFTIMVECVAEYKGSINKFLGDSLLAVFGAPTSYIDNTSNSVFCALAMVERLKELNTNYMQEFENEITLGIGINTGEVIVGNIGVPEHIEYTVVGETVNIGLRVKDLTINHPNTILLTQQTYNEIQHLVNAESIGCKNLTENNEIEIYKVNGRKN